MLAEKGSHRKNLQLLQVRTSIRGHPMSHFKPPCINPTALAISFFSTALSFPLSLSFFSSLFHLCILCECFIQWFSHVSLLNLDLSLDGENLMDLIPRSCKFPLDVVHYTQVLSMGSLQKEGIISELFRPDSGRQPITGVWQEKKLFYKSLKTFPSPEFWVAVQKVQWYCLLNEAFKRLIF